MAQHNTDYGLVYNDDGSLCVTKRTDIIPFSGVTSYAVETGTTNLFDINNITVGGGPAWNFNISDPTKKFSNVIKVNPTGRSTYAGLDVPISVNASYSGQVWCYVSPDFDGNLLGLFCEKGLNALDVGYDLNKKGTWQFLTKENIIATSDLGRLLLYVWDGFTSGYVLFARPQIEKKPFASSFVNGTRPTGRLVVPKEKLGFNPATDDWVVHYWKYPVATHINTLDGFNRFSFGDYTADRSISYIYWGKKNGSNVFVLHVVYNDNTYGNCTSSTFDPAWYFRHWHHEVLLKHGNEMQYWVDGIQRIAFTLTKPLLNNFTAGLTVGGSDDGQYPENSYIANLCYGLYTDQWTPEYIQEIYQQRNGFFVPPKAVIV